MSKFVIVNTETGAEMPVSIGLATSEETGEELVDRLLSDFEDATDPQHYDFPGGVQVIDITRHLDFLTGNVVKYVSRAGRKGSRLEDLLKARKYLDWAVEKEEGCGTV